MPLSAATNLPTGTVTFLFTDIQGSTKLASALPLDRWSALLEEHYALLREAFAATNGVEVNTEGDAFFVAFASASDAVAACAAGQRVLNDHAWPDDAVIRVRMGLHSGEAAAVGGDYIGFEVHRAARIAATGHGGQVVLSDATQQLVRSALPDGVRLVDLGEHRLKDLSQPERIWQLAIEGLPDEFPALKSLDYTPNNLPTQLTSFIGREAELAEGVRLLAGTRLLTLTGPGGTGKTRLSLQIAAESTEQFKDGVFFVPLAPIDDPDLVPSAIVDALKVQNKGTRPPLDVLSEHIAQKELLLVLDNFEQVLPAAAAVAEILKAAPRVKAVASSRAPLRVYGEQEYPIPPLALPDDSAVATLESVSQFASVQLFVERAVSVKPDFEITNQNAPAVAAICALVDGLPLAIELAAARIRLFPPETMLKRLETSLSDLGGGARDLPARQQTLRGAIEWSYRLLDPSVQALMARLSVFVRGASLDHIEVVCGPGLDLDLLTGLETLVEQSMLRPVEGAEQPRFFMLHVIREFALEQVAARPDAEEVRERHAQAFLALAETAAPQLTGPEARRWADRLDLEHPNIRAALTFFRETGQAEAALRLVAALWRFWSQRGHVVEGTANIRLVLEMPHAVEHPKEALLAWEAAGGMGWWAGDPASTTAAYDEALRLARELGDKPAVARNLYNSVFPKGANPDVSEAVAIADEAIAAFEDLDDAIGAARVRWIKSNLVMQRGDVQGSYDLAAFAVDQFRKSASPFDLTWALHSLGLAQVKLGDLDAAGASFREGYDLLLKAGDITGQTLYLGDFSDLAARRGDGERAATLRGASAALQQSTGSKIEETVTDSYVDREDIQSLIDEETYRRAYEAGLAMTPEEAARYAREGA